MAGKEKREALDAIRELQVYLRRDTRASSLIESVSKYVTTIRRKNSELSETAARVESSMLHCRGDVNALTANLLEANNALVVENGRAAQFARDLGASQKRIAELEARLESTFVAGDPCVEPKTDSERLFFSTAKHLRRRIRKAPKIAITSIPSRSIAIDPFDIVREWTNDEFLTLGMMCAVLSAMSGETLFRCDRLKRSKADDDRMRGMVNWMSGWIDFSDEALEKIHDNERKSFTPGGNVVEQRSGRPGRFCRRITKTSKQCDDTTSLDPKRHLVNADEFDSVAGAAVSITKLCGIL